MIEVNKKLLVIAVAVAMLALPMSAVSATKPITLTLTGTFTVFPDPQGADMKIIEAGESGVTLMKIRELEVMWSGDITGSGHYDANWLIESGSMLADKSVGTHFLEDAAIYDIDTDYNVGTGDLAIGHNHDGFDYTIKSGSDDFRSIRGKGMSWPIDMLNYGYEIVVQINP